MKADLAIYTHVLGVPGQYESVALMLSHKMDFNCCANRDSFRKSITYISGCACHILHNTSSKAATAFATTTGFDIEELVVDVTYWFDKSTKRKAGFEEFSTFCDTTYKDIVSHVTT